MPPRMATCHPERRHYGKGLCPPCYGASRYIAHPRICPSIMATCHPERKHYGKGLCQPCYNKSLLADPIHAEKSRVWRLRYLTALKLATLNAYGGPRCICCGETLVRGLTIDHINGDGGTHRKEHGTGTGLYHWLKKNNYPPGFQVLCWTCNVAKGMADHCPHQDLNPSL
jgi:hypothetical protein